MRASPAPACDDLAERLELLGEAAANILAKRKDALIGNRVVGVVAALPAADDPFVPQNAEMLGDVLLCRADRVGQILHARLSGARLYACKASVDMFGLTMDDFVPQVEDIISVGEFYEKAAGGQVIFT